MTACLNSDDKWENVNDTELFRHESENYLELIPDRDSLKTLNFQFTSPSAEGGINGLPLRVMLEDRD